MSSQVEKGRLLPTPAPQKSKGRPRGSVNKQLACQPRMNGISPAVSRVKSTDIRPVNADQNTKLKGKPKVGRRRGLRRSTRSGDGPTARNKIQ